LEDAVRVIAMIGGYLGWNGDSHPRDQLICWVTLHRILCALVLH